MSIIVFSPKTVVKLSAGRPTITFSRKSGLISLSGSFSELIGVENRHFIFNFDEKDRTGYLIPDNDGFEFRKKPEQKGLALNHTALVKHFLSVNGIPEDVKSFRFTCSKGVKTSFNHAEGLLIFPLIKTI